MVAGSWTTNATSGRNATHVFGCSGENWYHRTEQNVVLGYSLLPEGPPPTMFLSVSLPRRKAGTTCSTFKSGTAVWWNGLWDLAWANPKPDLTTEDSMSMTIADTETLTESSGCAHKIYAYREYADFAYASQCRDGKAGGKSKLHTADRSDLLR